MKQISEVEEISSLDVQLSRTVFRSREIRRVSGLSSPFTNAQTTHLISAAEKYGPQKQEKDDSDVDKKR